MSPTLLHLLEVHSNILHSLSQTTDFNNETCVPPPDMHQSQCTCLVVCKLFIYASWETNLSTKVQPFCVAPLGFHLLDFIHFKATYIRILVHHFQCDWYIHSSSLQSLSTGIFLNWHSLNFTPCSLKFMGSDKCTVLQSHRLRVTEQHSTQPALVLILPSLYFFYFFPESLGTQLCYNKRVFIFVRNTIFQSGNTLNIWERLVWFFYPCLFWEEGVTVSFFTRFLGTKGVVFTHSLRVQSVVVKKEEKQKCLWLWQQEHEAARSSTSRWRTSGK